MGKKGVTVRTISPITFTIGSAVLSGIHARGSSGVPRATILALHGAGMSSDYFAAEPESGQSFMQMAVSRGFNVLALDRPGYGESERHFPDGLNAREQSEVVSLVIADYSSRFDIGAGILIFAHSFGGMVALESAASKHGLMPLALEISGLGYEPTQQAIEFRSDPRLWPFGWGPASLYSGAMLRAAQRFLRTTPKNEKSAVQVWHQLLPSLAARVTSPIRMTFAEHENWWQRHPAALDRLRRLFRSNNLTIETLNGAGHNIGLGITSSAYHRVVLAFFERVTTSAE
ncbi:alpha/beta hydrolase [Glutamicibacter sp. 287]|uniref:alpha/beta hydrolase n=1 Tax=Glutamicibacter TaxID=1742989 RepID=UPI000BB9259D|nr:alpha/beta hydrolase [Glutamicibacter sp. BW80]PCC27374.1 hypothetical protein CIK76_17220 [Glutamicibacter sp. BW80]